MSASTQVLVVDDERATLDSTRLTLRAGGIRGVEVCQDSLDVLDRVTPETRVVLLDLQMPGVDGEGLLPDLREQRPDLQIIIVTADNRIETAVRCMRAGAVDYLPKPVNPELLLARVKRALAESALRDEHEAMRERFLEARPRDAAAFGEIITSDPAMLRMFAYLEIIARAQQPVLVCGETGTGKELVARALHRLARRDGPFVAVNVSGLDDESFGEEVFGRVAGAYAGAHAPRPGLIEAAGEGTLFLDQIGDLSEPSQLKLLRVIQEREYRPLGDDRSRPLRARIVASTHPGARKSLRPDLYYRLRGYEVTVPPLRDRVGDLPALIRHCAAEAAADLGRSTPGTPLDVVRLLSSYPFPGNVRELKAIVAHAVALADDELRSADLAQYLELELPPAEEGPPRVDRVMTEAEMIDFQRENVLRALERAHWRVSGRGGAAELLGLKPSTLTSRMNKLGIKRR